MVSYDIYKNRIQRIAAVKNFIVNFRVLFIILIALILATVSAFLIAKGIVVGGLTLPDEIIYGDSFEPESGSALFSDLKLEYALVESPLNAKTAVKYTAKSVSNEDYVWTETKPDKAGKYYVRTVSTRSFNIKSYGAPLEFEIKPRPVEFLILDDSVVYGSQPDEYVFTLVGGDKLIASGLKFNFENIVSTVAEVCANASSVKVVDKNGNDVTYCYNISTPVKQITLLEKQITASPAGAEFEYDGSPVDYKSVLDEKSLGELCSGDTAEIEIEILDDKNNPVAEPVDAGTYTVNITSMQIMSGESDVKYLYDINFKPATLTITRRPITITTASYEREYNGLPLVDHDFSFEGAVESHKVCEDGNEVSILNVGTAVNSYLYRIFDGEDADVTDNYQITYNYGTLSVLQREINLKTESGEKVYDGAPLFVEGHEITNLVEGHREIIASASERTIVGESANVLSFAIFDEEGSDVTRNYHFNNTWGILSVTPRPVTITTGSFERQFDGTILFGASAGAECENLVDGHYCADEISAQITYVGSVDNDTTYKIFDSLGSDVTENYDIKYECGTLEITPRMVTLQTADLSWVYDGYIHYNTFEEIIFVHEDKEGIVSGHGYEITSCEGIHNVGTAQNKCLVKFVGIDGEDVSDNYQISECIYGTLTITPRPLTITTGSASREFDGKPFVYTDGATGDNLADGQSLSVDESLRETFAFVTFVGNGVQNEVYYIIVNEDEGDVSENYEISYVWGTISITPFKATVKTSSASKEYDGTPLYSLAFDEPDRWTQLNHSLVIVEELGYASITYIQNGIDYVDNVFYLTVLDEEGGDVSSNYAITYDWGKLSIEKKALTIFTGDAQKVYDGTALFGHHAEPSFDGLVDGESYRLNNIDKIIDVQVKDNETTYITYYNDNNNITVINTTECYDITYEYGKLTITPRPITITTGSVSKVYDGEKLQKLDGAEADDLVLSHKLELDTNRESEFAYVINVNEGKIENTVYYLVVNSSGEDLSGNYDISYEFGEIWVTVRPIVIITLDDEKIYDGTPLSCTSGTDTRYTDENGVVFEGLVNGAFLEVSDITTITDAGQATNIYTCVVIEEVDGERSLSENYEIIGYEYGTLTVTKRPIIIVTGTAEHEYDGTAFSYINDNKAYYTENRTTYVETPAGLVLTHTLKVVESEYIASITDVGTVNNILTCIVVDGDIDVTKNYDIAGYVYGTLEVYARKVTITTGSARHEYDGNVFYYIYGNEENTSENTADRLVDGHRLKVETVIGKITEVGTVQNELTCLILDGERDVTFNYEISYVYGTLEVYARKITITTGSAQHEYDGNEFYYIYGSEENTSENTADRLVEGHRLKVETVIGKITEVGTVQNELTCIILDGERDVTSNYEIDYVYGTLEVYEHEITITTGSVSHVYDGNELYYTYNHKDNDSENTASWLAEGHHLKVETVTGKITDVGTVDNVLTCIIVDENETDVSRNYKITDYYYGRLTVTPRPIIITTGSDTKVYDGTALQKLDGFSADDLVLNHYLVLDMSRADEFASVTDVYEGKVPNELYFKVEEPDADAERNKVVNGNYQVVGYNLGELEITPREIKIVTASDGKVYDGKILQKLDGFKVAEGYNLVLNHELALDLSRQNEFAFALNAFDGIDKDGKVANQLYFNVVEPEADYERNLQVNQNYKVIGYILGTLTITKKDATITTLSDTKEYDGKPLSNTNSVFEGFVEGQTCDRQNTPQITDVGELENAITYKIFDGSFETTDNYEIDYVYGKLSVTKRSLVITTGSARHEYDGNEFYYTDGNEENTSENTADRLVEGHRLKVDTVIGKITDVGTVQNELTCTILDGERDVTANYDITDYIYGTLEVYARNVTITTGSARHEYDDNEFCYIYGNEENTSENTADRLVEGHRLKVETVIGKITEVGNAQNELTCIILDGERDVTSNYEIDYVYGTLEVYARKITITTANDTKEYDGSELFNEGKSADRLVSGHELEAVGEYVSVIDAGERQNERIYEIYKTLSDGTKIDVTYNYEIDYDYGKLIVMPKEINITFVKPQDYTYGDTVVSEVSYTPVELVNGESLNAKVFFSTDSNGSNGITPKDAGVYYVIFDGSASTISGGREKLSNYSFTQDDCSFNINKKTLYISLGETVSKIYDGLGYTFPEDNFYFENGTSTVYDEVLSVAVKYLSGNSYVSNPVNAGEYTIELDASNCKIDSIINAGTNYDIQPVVDTVSYKITQKGLTVTLSNAERRYNGRKFDFNNEGDDVFAGERITVVGLVKGTLTYTVNVEGEGIHVGVYDLIFDETAWSVDGDLKSNYTLDSFVNSEVKITKREITVTVNNAEAEYTGEIIEGAMSYESETQTGEAGFVNGDDSIKDYIYLLGGAVSDPVEIGIYDVKVSFENNSIVTQNYDITSVDGSLKITGRFVTVVIESIDDFEYDGQAFDENTLSYIHFHTSAPLEEGFMNGDENCFDFTYTLTDNYDATYSFGDIIQAGIYTVKLEVAVKPQYAQSIGLRYSIAKVNDITFTVESRKIYVLPDPDNMEIVKDYDKQSVIITAFGQDYHYGDSQSGFVNNDRTIAQAEYTFEIQGSYMANPVNAGEYNFYVSKIFSADGFIDRNYIICSDDYKAISGSLTINQVFIIFTAQSQKKLYDGTELKLSSDGYKMLKGELVSGDKLTVEGNTTLSPTTPTAVVGIESYNISDTATGEDMTANYNVVCSYNDLPDELKYNYTVQNPDTFSAADFLAFLSFTARKVTVKQILPEKVRQLMAKGELVYNGSTFTVTAGAGEKLFEIVSKSGDDGLLAGNELFVLNSTIMVSAPSTVKKWLMLGVNDNNGANIMWAYSISIEDDSASYITFDPIKLNVTISSIPEAQDGTTVLEESCYTIEGNIISSADIIEISMTVVTDGNGGKIVTFDWNAYQKLQMGTTEQIITRKQIYDVTIN